MPQSLFLIFNHRFTAAQQTDARDTLGIDAIVSLPEDLQALWSQVPPDLPDLASYLHPLMKWLVPTAQADDYALIQGDFGATYLMVRFALEHGLIPIYATSRRLAQEEHQADGTVKLTHHFRHQNFRRYGV